MQTEDNKPGRANATNHPQSSKGKEMMVVEFPSQTKSPSTKTIEATGPLRPQKQYTFMDEYIVTACSGDKVSRTSW